MTGKTQGIVLHAITYSDTRLMVHIYTEAYGRMSCVAVRGIRKNAMPGALLMPLSIIDMEIVRQRVDGLYRLSEVKAAYPLGRLSSDPVRNALALFLAEVLFRTLKESGPDGRLFDFLTHSIRLLESTEAGIANFHLAFLLRLLRYLGVFPDIDSCREGYWFDMKNGVFVDSPPLHSYFLNRDESRILASLFRISYENMSLYAFSRHERVIILDRIIAYYRFHLPEVPEIRSLAVLQSLFD
ncbi:MAG: DNA repair protein RecO [Tannerellaceae bacterium]|jgi:DNA repair protein RecO (recombination protein O)|nr:DNA repair protein RecO [Tannerellaceae bacterium]